MNAIAAPDRGGDGRAELGLVEAESLRHEVPVAPARRIRQDHALEWTGLDDPPVRFGDDAPDRLALGLDDRPLRREVRMQSLEPGK